MPAVRGLASALLCAATAAACSNAATEETTGPEMPVFEQVTAEQWAALGAQRIFFGHQSVGENLIDGMRDVLAENPQIKLPILEVSQGAQMAEPGLYHSRIGENGKPSSKLAAFREIVTTSNGGIGTALLKYCYVDVTRNTDPDALFAEYQQAVDALRASQPDLVIVHMTLPLRTDIGTLRYVAAVVRGKNTGREVNLIRHRYNELMRKTYGGKEPIFDIARLEATEEDGSPVQVRYKGAMVPVLAPVWTYDGGHLNEAGRKRMAKAFLAMLANIYAGAESAS
jgi:hypothetical protein